MPVFTAYLREDGSKGIRNALLVCYLVECAKYVAEEISNNFGDDVELVGFPGCYPNSYAHEILEAITTHPNTGAVLLVSLGCESMDKQKLFKKIKSTGRDVELVTIQESGGTLSSINKGISLVERMRKNLLSTPVTEMEMSELVIGTICGGSDGTSGISGNPAAGYAFDMLISEGATCIFEETGELIGCEHIMAERAESEKVAEDLIFAVEKAADYYQTMGHGSFAVGNAEGGLTTQEEKSMGAYVKSGNSKITGVLKPAMTPEKSGLFLLDVVPDGQPLWGFPNVNDNSEIIELISCGAHVILFVTGLGSVVGSAISPVIKICANPDTCERLHEDMDINAGTIIKGTSDIPTVGKEIYQKIYDVARGEHTKSEALGHREFVLGYKYFDQNSHCGIRT